MAGCDPLRNSVNITPLSVLKTLINVPLSLAVANRVPWIFNIKQLNLKKGFKYIETIFIITCILNGRYIIFILGKIETYLDVCAGMIIGCLSVLARSISFTFPVVLFALFPEELLLA